MQIGSIAPAGREDCGETGSVSGESSESSNGDSIASSPEEYYVDTETVHDVRFLDRISSVLPLVCDHAPPSTTVVQVQEAR